MLPLVRLTVALAALAAVAAVAPRDAAAQVEKGSFGLGLIVGDPSGVSGKLYFTDDTAIDFALGVGVVEGGLTAHSDFLWHPMVLINEDKFVMPVYVGPGLRLLDRSNDASDDDFLIGIRGAGGILFDFREIPLDVFVEFALVLDLVVSDGGDDNGAVELNISPALGARYYF